MTLAKILIVEDDQSLANQIKAVLHSKSYSVEHCPDGTSALGRLEEQAFDLVVLDLVLPDLDGLAILEKYRALGGNARVLVISGRAGTDDKIAGLQFGADDYLAKPLDLRELFLRVETLLKRSREFVSEKLTFEDIQMDTLARRVSKSSIEIILVQQEFVLLEFLLRYPNRVFSPKDLLRTVWGGRGSVATVRTHVKMLRKKLDAAGGKSLIKTIQGFGYCLSNEW